MDDSFVCDDDEFDAAADAKQVEARLVSSVDGNLFVVQLQQACKNQDFFREKPPKMMLFL